MLITATALPVVTVGSPLPQLGDFNPPYCISLPSRRLFAISGLDTGSPFTAIGASREAMLGVLSNRCCCLVCGLLHRLLAPGPHQQHHRHRLSLAAEPEHPAGTGALCLCVRHLIEMGKLPFDLAEAEQELQEGPL